MLHQQAPLNTKYPFIVVLASFCLLCPTLAVLLSFFTSHYFFHATVTSFMISIAITIAICSHHYRSYSEAQRVEETDLQKSSFDKINQYQKLFDTEKYYNPAHPLYKTFHHD
jgi:hypothetical protein